MRERTITTSLSQHPLFRFLIFVPYIDRERRDDGGVCSEVKIIAEEAQRRDAVAVGHKRVDSRRRKLGQIRLVLQRVDVVEKAAKRSYIVKGTRTWTCCSEGMRQSNPRSWEEREREKEKVRERERERESQREKERKRETETDEERTRLDMG
jgi:hypothetical protein